MSHTSFTAIQYKVNAQTDIQNFIFLVLQIIKPDVNNMFTINGS